MPVIAADIAKHYGKARRMPMLEGFLYEPRAFWSVGRLALTAQTTTRPRTQVSLNREHFYNGEKYPITLPYVLISAVGYVFDQYSEPGQAITTRNFRNDNVAQLDFGQLRIAARQRQHYAKIPISTQGLIPRPRWEPGAPEDPAAVIPAAASSLYNCYRWEYDAPMVIPARGDLEYALSTYLFPGNGFQNELNATHAQILFTELGTGPFGSNARVSNRFEISPTSTPVSWQDELWAADGFGAQVPVQPPPIPGVWNADIGFRAKDYAHQNKTSDGSIPVAGVKVAIDQRLYDASITSAKPAVGAGIISSLGSKIGTRARTRHGGTGAWWWRPGAPLALVSPHRTTAWVLELRRPITLGPGDSLEVDLTFPDAPTVGQTTAFSVNQLGVSFCGYAAIEA